MKNIGGETISSTASNFCDDILDLVSECDTEIVCYSECDTEIVCY